MSRRALSDVAPELTAQQHRAIKKAHSAYDFHQFLRREAARRNPARCDCCRSVVTPAVVSKRRGPNTTLLFTTHTALVGCPHSDLLRTTPRTLERKRPYRPGKRTSTVERTGQPA